MRAVEFLIESEPQAVLTCQGGLQADKVEPILETIAAECAPFIRANHSMLTGSHVWKRWLYRGMRLPSDVVIVAGEPRSDRKPKDTTIFWHNLLNKFFMQRFGYPYRNGTFVSTHLATALDYGNPFVIFPRGEFEICWSPDIRDATEEMTDPVDNLGKYLSALGKQDWDYAASLGLNFTSQSDVSAVLMPFRPWKKVECRFANYILPGHEDIDFMDSLEKFLMDRVLPQANYQVTREYGESPNELMVECGSYYAIHARRPHHFDAPHDWHGYLDWMVSTICRL